MELSGRIKLLRIENGLTQKALGKKLGVSDVSVRCWENGTKNPSMNALISMSDLFSVSTDYLLGLSVYKSKDDLFLRKGETNLLSDYRSLDDFGKKAVDTICAVEKARVVSSKSVSDVQHHISKKISHKYIPKYITPSAAGYSAPIDGTDFEMIMADDTVPPDADFAVCIQGNSMLPYIENGDTVYVKKCNEIEIGDIGIFCVDGSMYCKQYYIDADKNLTLVSSNPDLRDTNVFVKADSGSSVICYGKVLLGYRISFPDYFSYK